MSMSHMAGAPQIDYYGLTLLISYY